MLRQRVLASINHIFRRRASDLDGLLNSVSRQALKGHVGILASSEQELEHLRRQIRIMGGQVMFSEVYADDPEALQVRDLQQASTLILAIFNKRVYQLRSRLVAGLLQAGQSELPRIIAPSYPYCALDEDELFNTLIKNLAKKTEWNEAFWRGWKSLGCFQLLRLALSEPGDCMEFGCYWGMSASMLAETMEVFGITDKKIFLFDTWQGMPSTNPAVDNYYKQGDFSDTNIDKIRQRLEPWKDRFEYVQGDICTTIKQQPERPLCYVRIDVDLYHPTLAIMQTTYDWMVPKGVIYFDDYVSELCVGERLAIDEFLHDKTERPHYMIGERAYIIKGIP